MCGNVDPILVIVIILAHRNRNGISDRITTKNIPPSPQCGMLWDAPTNKLYLVHKTIKKDYYYKLFFVYFIARIKLYIVIIIVKCLHF